MSCGKTFALSNILTRKIAARTTHKSIFIYHIRVYMVVSYVQSMSVKKKSLLACLGQKYISLLGMLCKHNAFEMLVCR